MMGFLADYLDLTDAQRAQVKDIMAKEKSDRAAADATTFAIPSTIAAPLKRRDLR